MAAAAAGIFSHQMTAGQALAGKTAMPMASSSSGTSGTSGSSDASGDSATISANDFLTLLVTEMQNQDPPADTDPNEYINQLVQVNSLEQLIDINQTLTADSATPASSKSVSTPSSGVAAATANSGVASTAKSQAASGAAGHGTATANRARALSAAQSATAASAAGTQAAARHLPGNLSVPSARPASRRVAHALSGRTHAQPISGGPAGTQ